jgi:hypothetical protein
MLNVDMKKAIGILTGLGATLYFALPAWAQENNQVLNLCPVNPSSEQGTNFNQLCNVSPSGVLGTVITFIFILAIIIALIYLIWGGIKWITSGGDKGNVETARGQIIAAVIGLIITFLAYFIINIVLTVFLGMDVNSIGLPSLPDATPQSAAPNGPGTGQPR